MLWLENEDSSSVEYGGACLFIALKANNEINPELNSGETQHWCDGVLPVISQAAALYSSCRWWMDVFLPNIQGITVV